MCVLYKCSIERGDFANAVLFSGYDNHPEHGHHKAHAVSQTNTSVALPYELENALIGRFLGGLSLEGAGRTIDENTRPTEPFLTVVTRTQGLRLDSLREVLLCLTGQSCTDFEHMIVGHRLSPESNQMVLDLIEESPDWLRRQTRFIPVNHGNRTAPLNIAFAVARGRYVAVLDDDDLVLGHWVETFRNLAFAHWGSVLRCVAVYQTFDQVETNFGRVAAFANGEIINFYPSSFDLFSHLQENRTPPLALAYPRAAFRDMNIKFDESLSTYEDWDYLIRAAAICGVASSNEITGIYRHWSNRSSSRTVHSAEEWTENQNRIRIKQNELEMLIPAGSAGRLVQILNDRDLLARAVGILASSGKAINQNEEIMRAVKVARNVIDSDNSERLEELRTELLAYYDSIWWRISAPVRWISAISGRGRFDRPMPDTLTAAHLRMAINKVKSSTSWRVSAPIRELYYRLTKRRQL